jgi:hypothetical protein
MIAAFFNYAFQFYGLAGVFAIMIDRKNVKSFCETPVYENRFTFVSRGLPSTFFKVIKSSGKTPGGRKCQTPLLAIPMLAAVLVFPQIC